MSEVVEHFQREARITDENEADEVRHKLETLVNNILTEVEKQDERFQSTLIQSGSVYEGVKVHKPDEFDFMVRINCLTNKPSMHPSDKGQGYVKLALNEDEWTEFKDEQGFFSPNLLSRHFKKLVSESLSNTEVPEGLVILRTNQQLLDSTWGPVYFTLLGNSSGQDSPSGLMYSETHGPATTLYLRWQGGESYNNLEVTMDLTLSLEYLISLLPVQLAKLPHSVDEYLHRTGFHVVPAGFDSWRISFSVAEREILRSSPDGFKVCFRVLKVARNTISELLGLDPSLVPSYIFKTVLLSQLFKLAGHRWDKDCWSQLIDDVIKAILQGIVHEKIPSFFIPGYNLLSMTDHENKLRQCILKEMQNELRGLKMKLAPEDVKETRQQIRVLEMIDLLEYVVFSSLGGKDPTTVWNKMFVNIDNIPQSHKYGHFWNQVTDLNTKKLDENVYNLLIRIWSIVEAFFKRLLSSLQGELNLLAQKFYIRTCEKKKEYELKHQVTAQQRDVTQIRLHQLVYEIAHDLAECYTDDEGYAFWSNLHKGVPFGNRSCFFKDVAEVTVNSGSDQGLAMFKERMKVYLAFVPEPDLMTLVVNYIRQIFYFAQDILKVKLDYIPIPELDLD